MPETPAENSHSSIVKKSRRRNRFVAAIVFCTLSLVVAICLPLYQSVQLLRFVDQQGGSFQIEHNHPSWLSGWIDEEAYIPGVDCVRELHISEALGSFVAIPISQSQFDRIPLFPELQQLTIDVSNCDPESLSQLGNLKQLEWVILSGVPQEADLGWAAELPKLTGFCIENRSFSGEEWRLLKSLPQIQRIVMQQTNYDFTMDRISGSSKWQATLLCEPTKEAARKLVAAAPFSEFRYAPLTKDLARKLIDAGFIDLAIIKWQQIDPEFWELINRHTEIETLHLTQDRITDGSLEQAEQSFCFTNKDFNAIEKMPALKKIVLEEFDTNGKPVNSNPLPPQDLPEEMLELHKNRPDIEIILE